MSEKPFLVIMTGLTGTGKTEIAKKIAKIKKYKILSSDVERKKMLNIKLEEHHFDAFEKGIYTKDITVKVYNKLFELAEKYLIKKVSVIIDASFLKKNYRESAQELAKRVNSKFLCIEVVCAEETVRRRLALRLKKSNNPSDGRIEIYEKQKEIFEAITNLPPENYIKVDTTNGIEKPIEKILLKLAGEI